MPFTNTYQNNHLQILFDCLLFLLLFNLSLCLNRYFSSESQILMFFNWFIGWLRICLLLHYYCSWPINDYQQIWAYRTFRTLRFSTLLALGYLDCCIDRLLPRLLFLTMLRPEPRLYHIIGTQNSPKRPCLIHSPRSRPPRLLTGLSTWRLLDTLRFLLVFFGSSGVWPFQNRKRIWPTFQSLLGTSGFRM